MVVLLCSGWCGVQVFSAPVLLYQSVLIQPFLLLFLLFFSTSRFAVYEHNLLQLSSAQSLRSSPHLARRCHRKRSGHLRAPKTQRPSRPPLAFPYRRLYSSTSKLLCTLRGHLQDVNQVVVSLGGSRAISVPDGQTVRVWHIDNGAEQLVLRDHTSDAYGVAVPPDGNTTASASSDGTVKLWSTASGWYQATLTNHGGRAYEMAVHSWRESSNIIMTTMWVEWSLHLTEITWRTSGKKKKEWWYSRQTQAGC